MEIDILKDLTTTVRGRRRQLKLSQEDLAGLAECSRATIIAIESGTQAPRLDLLVRVLAVLGLEIKISPQGDHR